MLLVIYMSIMNTIAFVCYGIDKYRARHSKWRISEACLITLAVLGGALGALLGMLLFHHKTRKKKFTFTVPVFFVLWTAFCIFAAIYFYHVF